MAISECDEHIEVRIKRPPADSLCTYFEEFVDPKLSGAPAGKVCESYIIAGEHDAQYLIEVILKPGFKRYGATSLRVEIWLGNLPSRIYCVDLSPIGKGGLQEEQVLHAQSFRVIEDGAGLLKRLGFSYLETASGLDNKTTVLGLDTPAMGTIRIDIQRSTSSRKGPSLAKSLTSKHNDSDADMNPSSKETAYSPDFGQGVLMIDEMLAKPENGGITHSMKFLDEDSRRAKPIIRYSMHGKPRYDKVGLVRFVFKRRTQDTMEALGIVKKPSPLWEWAWDDINILDREKVFKQLQKYNKLYEMKKSEIKIWTGVGDQERLESKAYSRIQNIDRKRIFEILQEKNKTRTRLDGRRDGGIQVEQPQYQQGPEGWKKHGDTQAVYPKKQEQSTDVGKGAGKSGPSGLTESPEQDRAQTVNNAAHADSFSAAQPEVVIEQKPSNIDQNANRQKYGTFGERSQAVKGEPTVKAEVRDATSLNEILPQEPTSDTEARVDIPRKQASTSTDVNVQNTGKLREPPEPFKHKSDVKSEPVVKSEPSTVRTIGDHLDQERPSKRRKISNTSTQSVEPSHSSKLFSATIDLTGDVPIVEPKAAIIIDLTAESSSSIKHKKLGGVSTSIPARQPQSKIEPSSATPVLDPLTSVKPESSHSAIKRRRILDLMIPSDTVVDAAEPSTMSSKERVRPTPTQAAQRGECSIQ